MTVELAQQAFEHWTPFEDPSEELVGALNDSLQQPTAQWDELYRRAVHAFNAESDGFWIEYAIKYASRASNPATAVAYLEHIVTHAGRYAALGGLFGAAVTRLGMVAPYPSAVLGTLMTTPPSGDDEVDATLDLARPAAFGAYVMTGTDFETGLNAGRQVRAAGTRPSVEQAEQLIRQWKAAH